jgi:hypothetical protein
VNNLENENTTPKQEIAELKQTRIESKDLNILKKETNHAAHPYPY